MKKRKAIRMKYLMLLHKVVMKKKVKLLSQSTKKRKVLPTKYQMLLLKVVMKKRVKL
jgi:hypothetical protein